MSARLRRPVPPGPVSRSSVHTKKSSLPGWYSHRKRRLLEKVSEPEPYCMSALANMRGVKA